MARTTSRSIIAFALAMASGQLPWQHFAPFLPQSAGAPRLLAQAIPDSPSGNPYGSGSVAVDPRMMNNYGPSGPAAPTTPSRPASWPGGSQNPANSAPPAGGNPPPPASGPRKDPAEPPYDPAQPLARVGSEVIQATELLAPINQGIEAITVQNADELAKLSPEEREVQLNKIRRKWMEQALDDMIKIKLLVSELRNRAPAEGIKKHEEMVRKEFNTNEINHLMGVYKATSVIDLENKLRELGSSLDAQRTVFIERNMAFGWLGSQIKEEKKPTHEQLLAYYQENIKDWETPARAKWEQITVKFSNFPSKQEAWQALAQWGNEVLRGAAFAEVAKAHSQDFAAADGGIHDWASRGSLKSTLLDNALFALPVGGLSPIIEDEDGFHIVRVVERDPDKCKPFLEVQGEIRERMHVGDGNRQRLAYIEKLGERTPVWTVFKGDFSATASQPRAEPRR